MSVFFISDLHFGHKSILEFSPSRGGSDIESHNRWLIEAWNSVVKSNKRDLVWVLGDVAFSRDGLECMRQLKGRKKLVRGNHDMFPIAEYLEHFEEVYGLHKAYKMWLSHAPVHPDSLRNRRNIHGHVHNSTIDDSRYVNVCVEAVNGIPKQLEHFR